MVTPAPLVPASVGAEGARPAPGEGDQAGRANRRFHPTFRGQLNSAVASEVMARPVTFFKVGAPTASFRPAIEGLDLSKAAVTEEAVLSNLGGAPPPNLGPEGAKVGVRMWNRWAWNPSLSAPSCTLPPRTLTYLLARSTNSVMRVYITKEGETKRYCQELRPGMEAGWHSSP